MSRRLKKFYFTYKTTNIITGKWYLGMHSTNNLDDGYIGSGIYLSRSIKKYGKSRHSLEILKFFDNLERLRQGEKDLITSTVLTDDYCMNMKEGGQGGWTDQMRSQAKINKIKKMEENEAYRQSIHQQMSVMSQKQKTQEFRTKISNVLKELYKDPNFKNSQIQHRKKANIASHSPAAKEKRIINRKQKYDNGWRFMKNLSSGKRKFMPPEQIVLAQADDWVTVESRR